MSDFQTSRRPLSPLIRWTRGVYVFLVWLFAAGVVLQFFFAGLGVLVNPSYFGWHTLLGGLLDPLLLVMLIAGGLARVGWGRWGLNLLLWALLALQYVFIEALRGPLRALHVVNALALFWLALYLGRSSWRLVHGLWPAAVVVGEGSSSGVEKRPRGERSLGGLIVGGVFILLGVVILSSTILGNIFDNTPSPTGLSNANQSSSTSKQNVSSEGGQLFAQHCAACHGQNGRGGFGPSLVDEASLQDTSHVVKQILNGGGGMPAWKGRLSNEEVAAVATFIRTSWDNDYGPVTPDEVAAQR